MHDLGAHFILQRVSKMIITTRCGLKIVISTRWNLMVILKCREKVFQYYLLGSLDVVKVNQASLRKHATS